LASFADLRAVEAVLARLVSRGEPMVALGDRAPGQKERRWSQLVGESPEPSTTSPAGAADSTSLDRELPPSGEERLAALESQVARLTAMVAELRSELGLEGGGA
jgi:uncharacterized protein YceH (UPF0502 family)